MAMGRTSIRTPAKSGFSTDRFRRGFWPGGIVRVGLYARVSTHNQQTPSRPGELHPEPLTEPDVSLSTYPARATHRRLPPSAETKRVHPAKQLTHNWSRRE